MDISFHGAARTVTGTKHLITLTNGTKILLDCGMFQGMGEDTGRLNVDFGFDPSSIDFVLLSHAHIDHSGLLPKLVKDGFTGKIISSEPTFHLTELLLMDSAHIQQLESAENAEKDAQTHQPLYTEDDVISTMALFEVLPYNKELRLSPEVTILFSSTGHLTGSAAIHLTITENDKVFTIAFSGDVGRYRSALMPSPETFACADHIILEGTYGNKLHDPVFSSVDILLEHIKRTCMRQKGKLIIPAFSVGRTQEILFTLNQLELEKRLPPIKYYVDSPLSKKATFIIKNFLEHFNDRLQEILKTDDDPFDFEGLHFVDTIEESRSIAESDEPCVIISASGTADSGRVKNHISHAISSAANTILFAGYCQAKSTGGRLLRGEKEIRLFGNTFTVKASIESLRSMSAHGDVDDLTQFISCQTPEDVKSVFLVHGEEDCLKEFAHRLTVKGYNTVIIPHQHEVFSIS